jgi:hypothetical protein
LLLSEYKSVRNAIKNFKKWNLIFLKKG